MSSILKGYNYDIFISYRQKDNKGERWVSEFVEALKTELESTLKDNISLYVDFQTHDSLLETHDVDASLEDKLKCLIFIPIISRTYFDTKSFAWEHEFKAFLDIARNDRFGLKVKLAGGNVASRILPVQIHELDNEDKQAIEKELGGFIRGIEFIYKEPGVNRPLRGNEETPQNNLYHTTYRNQINKIANSIKELIEGMKDFEARGKENIPQGKPVPMEPELLKIPKKSIRPGNAKIMLSTAVIILAVLGLIFGGKLFLKDKVDHNNNGKISIAVVNFQNNTNDTTLNWLESGIPELLRTNLAANSNELSIQNSQVIQEVSESIIQKSKAGISSSAEIARKLNTNTYITGSFQRYGDNLLTLAKLIDTKTDEVLWAGKTLGDLNKINTLTDSLSILLKNFLEIKVMNQMAGSEIGEILTSSSDACRAYIRGRESLAMQENENALKQLLYAVEKDSNFIMASFFVANAYDALAALSPAVYEMNYRKLAALWIKKTYRYKEKLPEDYRLWLEMWYAYYITKNSQDVIRLCNMLGNSDIRSRYLLRDIGDTYMILEKYKQAFSIYERIEKINESWGDDWKNKNYYFQYTRCCYLLGLYNKGNKILENGIKLFPQDIEFSGLQAMYGGLIKDTIIVNKFFDVLAEQLNWTAIGLNISKANLYWETGNNDLAEKYLRKSKALSPDNDFLTLQLAKFLVEEDRDVDGGMGDILTHWKNTPKGEWNNDAGYFTALGFLKQGRLTSADSVLKILSDSTLTASVRLDRLKKGLEDSKFK